MSNTSSSSSSYNFVMIFVNFVCILVLYILVMYLFSKYMDIEEKILDTLDYQVTNDRQIQNLIYDVNYNDKYLTEYIKTKL